MKLRCSVVVCLVTTLHPADGFCGNLRRAFVMQTMALNQLDNDGETDGQHTFVEGEMFVSRRDEVGAMGGDPSFLPDDDEEGQLTAMVSTQEHGAVEEGMDAASYGALSPDMSSFSDIALSYGAVASALQQMDAPVSSDIGQYPTKSYIADESSEVDDILYMGGDPSFLDDGAARGSEKDDNFDDLVAMGGDPFFLTDNDDRMSGSEKDSDFDDLVAMGGDPFFHTDDDDSITSDVDPTLSKLTEKEKERRDLPTKEMLSQIATLSGPTAESLETMNVMSNMGDPGPVSGFDSEVNFLEGLEEMGGDPFFLDDSDVGSASIQPEFRKRKDSTQRYAADGQGPTPRTADEAIEDERWEWDGTVDEDAHFGLD